MKNSKLVRSGNVKRFPLETKDYTGYAEISYNDSCGNGHNSFYITGDWWDKSRKYKDPRNPDMCACTHDEIMKAVKGTDKEEFFKKAIAFHGVTTDGPLHYYANTLYHASDKDCNGRRKGEVSSYDTRIKFNDFPITFFIKKGFREKLLSMSKADFHSVKILPVEHKKEPGGYDYKPKFTFSCYPVREWYQCPFDSKAEAREFLNACKKFTMKAIKIPTAYSEGKERDIKAARNCAIWPHATVKQLTSKKSLSCHLGHVMKNFHSFIVNDCEFEY